MTQLTLPKFNCYQELGVDTAASPTEIRNAFRQRSKQTHPDYGGSHEAQVRINLAHEVLSDPIHRQTHDKYWQVFNTAASSAYTPPRSNPPPRPSARTTSPPPPPSRPRAEPPPRAPRKTAFDTLYARVNAHIGRERATARAEQPARVARKLAEFERTYQAAASARRQGLAYAVAATVVALLASIAGFHWLWIAVALAWFSYAGSSSEIKLGTVRVKLGASDWLATAQTAATATAEQETRSRLDALTARLGDVASLQALLTRSSTFDDSEEQIARRITGALFLMGYRPIGFERESRMLQFTDGEERLLIRYRHRDGMVTNITYVRRMVESMLASGIRRGYLFCTPGLSGNGADLARENGIKWYSLETMNTWIDEVCNGPYGGPQGDVLKELTVLTSFLSAISIQIPQRAANRYGRARHY